MRKDQVQERRQRIKELCLRTENILLGKEYSLSHEVICNNTFSIDAVELFVEKIIASTKRPQAENVALIRSFLETAICYLFSECNDDDCIYGSLYKLAVAFSNGLERNFGLSTFGIMIADAEKNSHYGQIDRAAFVFLKEKADNLRNQLIASRFSSNLNSEIDEYLDTFAVESGISCLMDDGRFQQSISELERLVYRIRISFDARDSDWKG